MSSPDLLDPMRTLEDRIADLEAIESARALLSAYARGCDENSAEAVAGLFAEDGVLDANGTRHAGRAAVAAFYAGRLDSPTRHLVTNTSFTRTGPGQLAAASLFLALSARERTSRIIVGTYDDEIVVTSGRAAFQSRAIRLHVDSDLIEGWGDLQPLLAGGRR